MVKHLVVDQEVIGSSPIDCRICFFFIKSVLFFLLEEKKKKAVAVKPAWITLKG